VLPRPSLKEDSFHQHFNGFIPEPLKGTADIISAANHKASTATPAGNLQESGGRTYKDIIIWQKNQ
jgi:hypothetical protein